MTNSPRTTPTPPHAAISMVSSGPNVEATMQAVVQRRYGPPDGLRLATIRRPELTGRQVLVRVHAAGLNPSDGFAVRGSPLLMRLATGLLRPRRGVPGFDLAGTVAATGPEVTRFKPGDAVFGAGHGTCAEYAGSDEDRLAPMPAGLDFVQAAATPTAALAALHGLRNAGRLLPGQQVLVIGAAGGVGSFAVQIAQALGAHVTGVCSTRNLDLVRSIGADAVIDHTREDFAAMGTRYDLILDNVENRTLADCRKALKPSGTLVLNSGTGATGSALLLRLVKPLLLSPFSRQHLRRYLSVPNHGDLMLLKSLFEAGKLVSVIDSTYPLRDTALALAHVETGRARGKVVVTL